MADNPRPNPLTDECEGESISSRTDADRDTKPQTKKLPADNLFDRIFKPVLLRSESARSFADFRDAIYAEIGPFQNTMEQLLGRQIVNALWQVERLEPLGVGIMNNATLRALENLIAPTSEIFGIDTNGSTKNYFCDDRARQDVQRRLAQLGMTENDVTAETFRIRSGELQVLNKQLSSALSSAMKLLQYFEDYRARSQQRQKQLVGHVGSDDSNNVETAGQDSSS